MRPFALAALAVALFSSCHNQPSNERLKVLIGATTIPAPGADPILDSIVILAGSKIRAVGERKDVPVPQASDRTDLTGEWIVPAPGSRIEPGATANLIVLHHPPNGIEPAIPGDAGARLVAGEWQLPETPAASTAPKP